jgi:hypothetical protein
MLLKENELLDPAHLRHACPRACLRRIIRKVPDAVEVFQEAAVKLLSDRHHGVLLTGVALMLEVCAVEPAAVEAYRRHVPALCKILRTLLMSGFAPEHDVSGITDPFLQVKVGCPPPQHTYKPTHHIPSPEQAWFMSFGAPQARLSAPWGKDKALLVCFLIIESMT